MPVEQIRPGQRGYGLTVFSGFKVERFEVEVIDVLTNFLPKQDVILMRGDHPVLRRAGVLGGMSGSPIYIDGKLVGALAYGWRFAKEPIFGVTPIKDMLAILGRRRRGPEPSGGVAGAQGGQRVGRTAVAAAGDRRRPVEQLQLALAERQQRWWRLPFSVRQEAPDATLTPLAVPLNVAGIPPAALTNLRRVFAPYGLEPVQGGGTGRAEGPTSLAPGMAVGVQMVRGDVSMSGTGTVTWAKAKKILAFGHSMFNAGEIYLPVVSARIHHSLANVARSFKLSSPARLLGTLVQDRQAGILADLSQRSAMIPMTVTMRNGARKSVYKVELAKHRMLTPALAANVLAGAISEAMADVAHATFQLTTKIALRGHPETRIVEQNYSSAGLRMGPIFNSHGLDAIRRLLQNPFAPAIVERIDLDVQVSYGERPALISGVSVGSNFVDPGQQVALKVRFRQFDRAEFSRTFTVAIPDSLAGAVVVVEVASGGVVRPELAPPESLSQLLDELPELYPMRSVVVTLKLPSEGVKTGGQVIRDLPLSVMDTLRSGARVRRESTLLTAARQVHPTRELVSGKMQIRLRVRDDGT